jgi:hypothetical protein
MEARTANFAKERVVLKRILRQHKIQFDRSEDTETLRRKVEATFEPCAKKEETTN